MRKGIKKMIRGFRFSYFVWVVILMSLISLGYDNLRLNLELLQFKEQGPFQLSSEVRELKASLVEIDSTLSRLNKFSSKLKVLTHIKDQFEQRESVKHALKSDVIPSKARQSVARDLSPQTNLNREEERDLQKIRKRVNGLRSEAEFHERMLAELVGFYYEQPALLASIPSLTPALGRITSLFGFRKLPSGGWQMHEGMDIAANFGTEVLAPADGVVEVSNFSPGYGQYVLLNHGYGLKTKFAHTSKILVKPGEWVKRGEKIALVGGSGRTRGVHLHYEISLNDVPVDPSDYMIN